MLIENTIFGTRDKVQISIDRIKFAFEIAEQRGLGSLYVCFSGGKDSTVLAELCRLAKMVKTCLIGGYQKETWTSLLTDKFPFSI